MDKFFRLRDAAGMVLMCLAGLGHFILYPIFTESLETRNGLVGMPILTLGIIVAVMLIGYWVDFIVRVCDIIGSNTKWRRFKRKVRDNW